MVAVFELLPSIQKLSASSAGRPMLLHILVCTFDEGADAFIKYTNIALHRDTIRICMFTKCTARWDRNKQKLSIRILSEAGKKEQTRSNVRRNNWPEIKCRFGGGGRNSKLWNRKINSDPVKFTFFHVIASFKSAVQSDGSNHFEPFYLDLLVKFAA